MKNIKKILAMALCLTLVLSILGSCKKTPVESPTPSADTPPSTDVTPGDDKPVEPVGASYDIGFQVWGAGVPILDSFGDAIEWCLTTLGHTYTRASDDFSADKELSNAQNFIAAGKDGIMIQLSAGPVLNQVAKECADKKIPLATYITIGDDPDIENLAKTNEYWVGACDSQLVLDGELVAQYALDAGCTKAVIIGGNIGDNSQDQRQNGFTRVFEAGGGKVLSVARCTDNSEAPAKAEDMLAANADADCLYAMVGDYVEGSMLAIENLGRSEKIKMFMSCVDATSAKYIQEGKIIAGNDGISLGAYIATTMIINFLDGHPIKDANGYSPRFSAKPIKVDGSNVDRYLSVFFSNDQTIKPVNKVMLEGLLWRNNPNVTYQTYLDLIDAMGELDYIAKQNGL
ncbi:MAG: sugar ABC transporter substrate-binding protein [Oscillospiraceae bacterium]|jgi:ABC-type sugar transport system substrate-binding protein|nr:sugar ABC transporter substrate-binding protein [Oscillospiraceae bacterium]